MRLRRRSGYPPVLAGPAIERLAGAHAPRRSHVDTDRGGGQRRAWSEGARARHAACMQHVWARGRRRICIFYRLSACMGRRHAHAPPRLATTYMQNQNQIYSRHLSFSLLGIDDDLTDNLGTSHEEASTQCARHSLGCRLILDQRHAEWGNPDSPACHMLRWHHLRSLS